MSSPLSAEGAMSMYVCTVEHVVDVIKVYIGCLEVFRGVYMIYIWCIYVYNECI